MDQARPWLTPSRTLAATIQPQLGATAISSGTGSAIAQPAISSRAGPTRCGERSGAQVGERLGEAEGDDERQHRGAGGEAEVVAADQRQRRALEADHRADERVDRDQQRELRGVLAQPELDRRRGHALGERAAGAVGGDDLGLLLGRRRDVATSASTKASSESNCSAGCGGARSRSSRSGWPTGRGRRPSRSSAPGRARGGRAASAAARSASGRACAPSPRRCARRARAGPAARRRRRAARRRSARTTGSSPRGGR